MSTDRTVAAAVPTGQIPASPPAAPVASAPAVAPPPLPPRSARRGAPKAKAAAVAFSGSTTLGLDPLIQACDENYLLPNERDVESFWTPNTQHFFAILNQMDAQMLTTKRFIDNAQAWLPALTHAFYSVIVNIHTMRCQSLSSTFPDEARLFLDWFEKQYDLKTIPIPGPLVPFFRTIQVIEGPSERYGMVLPRFPNAETLNMSRDNNCHYARDYLRAVPNPLTNLDQIRNFAVYQQEVVAADPNTTPPTPQVMRPSQNYVFYSTVHGQLTTDNSDVRWALLAPNATDVTGIPNAVRAAAFSYWRNHSTSIPDLNRTSISRTSLNLYQLFGFRGVNSATRGSAFDWFSLAIPVFQTYCKHWKNSVNMHQLQLTGIGAPAIKLDVADTNAAITYFFPADIEVATEQVTCMHRGTTNHFDHDVTRYVRRPISAEVDFNVRNVYDEYELVSLQYAMTTIMNVGLHKITAPAGRTAIVRATQRFGPTWDKTYEHYAEGHHVVGRYAGYLFGTYYSPVAL